MSKRRKYKRRFRLPEVVEYTAVRAMLWFLCARSPERIYTTAKAIGNLIRFFDRKHVRIARKNLERAVDFDPPGGVDAFIRQLYDHVGMVIAEIVMLDRLVRPSTVHNYVELKNEDRLHAELAKGRGVIVTNAHLGNWEHAGVVMGALGYNIHAVGRRQDNEMLNKYLVTIRERTGMKVVYKQNAIRTGLRALKDNGILCIVADQDARKAGVFVDFFGRPASTVKAPAIMARRMKCAILPTKTSRIAPFKYCIDFDEPVYPEDYPNDEEGLQQITQAFTSKIESYVRDIPGQWLWMHRRWKSKPPEESRNSEGAKERGSDSP